MTSYRVPYLKDPEEEDKQYPHTQKLITEKDLCVWLEEPRYLRRGNMNKKTLKELIIFLNQQMIEERDAEKKDRYFEIVQCLMLLQQYKTLTTHLS